MADRSRYGRTNQRRGFLREDRTREWRMIMVSETLFIPRNSPDWHAVLPPSLKLWRTWSPESWVLSRDGSPLLPMDPKVGRVTPCAPGPRMQRTARRGLRRPTRALVHDCDVFFTTIWHEMARFSTIRPRSLRYGAAGPASPAVLSWGRGIDAKTQGRKDAEWHSIYSPE